MMQKLVEREKDNNPIKVGFIGAGMFNSMTINQVARVPGIRVSIIADVVKKKATDAYLRMGYQGREIVEVRDVDTANHYIEKTAPVITDRSEILIESDIDVILEATGNAEVGARNAFNAIESRKNIVMATVETDVVVGPILEKWLRKLV